MSRTVSVTELKAHLSRFLRLVRSGEVVLVRDRDRVVARVEGAGPKDEGSHDERLARLEASGVIRRRRRALDPALLGRRVATRGNVVDAMLDERESGR